MSFSKGNNCLYVGQGEKQGALLRPDHIYRYAQISDWLKVWQIKGKSQLSRAECLAMHLFDPSENKNKAPRKRYRKECPICLAVDKIEKEINNFLY